MRQFSDTSEKIGVFVDQLPMHSMTPQQIKFAATHYEGTQKLTSAQAAKLRAHNPNFIVLHYRLGLRQADPRVKHLHNDEWGNDWEELLGNALDILNPSAWPDGFIHTTDDCVPLYRLLGSGVREYIADLSNPLWQEHWAQTVIAEAQACQSDGVFADSCHPPTGIPEHLALDSPLGKPPYIEYDYCEQLDKWFEYVYPKLKEAGLYLIPNVAGNNTGWDTTQGYYNKCDGVFLEGFAAMTSDWQMQATRTLKAIGDDKIYIAQQRIELGYTEGRLWQLANFLLLKNNHSYINLGGTNNALHWLPEYDLQIGCAIDEPHLMSGSDIAFREYKRAVILVNPTSSFKTWMIVENGDCFTDCQQYASLSFTGGGHIQPDGTVPAGEVTATPCGLELQVPPWSGKIIVRQCDWDRGDIWK